MVACAASLPPGVSELEHLNLATASSTSISVPRIVEAPVSLECTEWRTLEIGKNRLVIGLVKRIHVKDVILDPDSLGMSSRSLEMEDGC